MTNLLTSDLTDEQRRVIELIHKFSGMEPEDGEEWDSWYSAAFEMLSNEVGDHFKGINQDKHLSEAEDNEECDDFASRIAWEVATRMDDIIPKYWMPGSVRDKPGTYCAELRAMIRRVVNEELDKSF